MSGQQIPNIKDNTEQLVNDIQSLQNIEKQLFSNLETNPNLNGPEKNKIIEKINKISDMRINLYKTMGGVNTFFNSALQTSQGTLKQQAVAINIIENELNNEKKRLEALEQEKINKLRLVEINTYFGEKYEEHAILMQIVILTLVPIIILAILHNKGILPDMVYNILTSLIAGVGLFFFMLRVLSISSRDNMNYQAYDWYFDASSAPVATDSSSNDDPWVSDDTGNSCTDSACCADGTVWDTSLNQCTEGFVGSITEGMISQMINTSSNSNKKYKQNNNSNFQANNSDSFTIFK